MEHLEAARLLGVQTRRYFEDVLPLAFEVAGATVDAFLLFLRLLVALIRPLVHAVLIIVNVLRPHVLHLTTYAWQLFAKQSSQTIALELSATASVLLLFYVERKFGVWKNSVKKTRAFSRYVTKRYNRFVATLRRHSTLAATALPHFLFLAVAFLIETIFGSMLSPFVRANALLCMACLRPAVKTILLIYSVEVGPHEDALVLRDTDGTRRDVDENGYSSSATEQESRALTSTTDSLRKAALRLGHSELLSSALRRRASMVAREIENDGDNSNVQNRDVSGDDDSGQLSPVTPRSTSRDVGVVKTSRTHRSGAGNGSAARTLPATGLQRANRGRARPSPLDVDGPAGRQRDEIAMLQFWVVCGLVLATRSLAWYLFPAVLHSLLYKLDVFLMYFFAWMQISLTKGSALVYQSLAAVAGKSARKGSKIRTESKQRQQLGILLRLAVAAGVISEQRADEFETSLAESGLALIGLAFFITPRLITFIGTLLIGRLVPSYLSASTLQLTSGAAASRRNWLTYWAVYSVVDAVFEFASPYLNWVPLWYHTKMAIILWLQLPYYRGSAFVLDRFLMRVGGIATTVTRQTVTPRKRKLL